MIEFCAHFCGSGFSLHDRHVPSLRIECPSSMVRCRECCELCGVFVIVGNLFMLAIVAGLVVTAWILAGAIAVLLPFLLVLAILPGILIMYLWYWRNAKHDVSLNRVQMHDLIHTYWHQGVQICSGSRDWHNSSSSCRVGPPVWV